MAPIAAPMEWQVQMEWLIELIELGLGPSQSGRRHNPESLAGQAN